MDVSETSPGTLSFVFRDAKGAILDTEENTFARDGDFFERATDEPEADGHEHDRFGLQLIRDGLVLGHNLGGWFSANDNTVFDAWGAAFVLTRDPLPKVNATLWPGTYSGVEWIYDLDWDNENAGWTLTREYGELSATVNKAGSGYRLIVDHVGEEETDIVPAKASGSFLAMDFQEKGGVRWDDAWQTQTLVLDREYYRVIQVSPREAVLIGLSGSVVRVTPKQGDDRTPYHQADGAESNILYLVSTAHFPLEGQAVSIEGPDAEGPFTAKGLPSGVVFDRNTGALTGMANVKPGNYAVTRTAGAFSDTVYLRVQAFPSTLLTNPDSTTKVVYAEHEALLRAPLDQTPVGKVELKLAASGLFTGKLHTGSPTADTLKGRFSPDAEGSAASVSLTLSGGRALILTLDAEGRLDAVLNGGETTLGLAEAGDYSGRIRLHTASSPAPGGPAKGSTPYTLALSPVDAPESAPSGHGWATATINTAGLLAIKGKLADGRPLTGSLRATGVGYLPYLKPYGKLADACLAGRLVLSEREGGGHHVASSDGQLSWSKPAAAAKTDLVPVFGPTPLVARLEPWTKIVTAESFASLLGVEGDALAVSIHGGIVETEPSRSLPDVISFTVNKGKFASAVAEPVIDESTAAANTKAWAKIWKLSVNLANGTFTGHFVLSDTVPAPTKKNPDATKIQTRKVPVAGVFLAGSDASAIALGQYVVPGLAKTDPTPGGSIELGVVAR